MLRRFRRNRQTTSAFQPTLPRLDPLFGRPAELAASATRGALALPAARSITSRPPSADPPDSSPRRPAVEHALVVHRRGHACVSEQPLHGADVAAILEQVRREAVPRIWHMARLPTSSRVSRNMKSAGKR